MADFIVTSIVAATVNEFINYALFIVGIMIVYYIIKFFFVEPPTEAEHEAELEKQRKAFKELWDGYKKKKATKKAEREEKKKKAEEEVEEKAKSQEEKKEEQKERKVREKKKAVVKKLRFHLLDVIGAVNEAIKYLDQKKSEEAKKALAAAKRHMTKARDSEVLEEIAAGTPYLDLAKSVHARIVRERQTMDHLNLDADQLKDFNGTLGMIVKAIGELLERIYARQEAEQQAKQRTRQQVEDAPRKKKAVPEAVIERTGRK